jgi:uncharacterized membrane protein required for colicin V production
VAYVLIFSVVMLFGALIAGVIVRAFKLIGLSLIDRFLGAAFGGVRALVGLIIVTLMLLAFVPSWMPRSASGSTFAPYIIGASRIASAMAPFEIRSSVEKAYNSLRERVEELRSTKRIPSREE